MRRGSGGRGRGGGGRGCFTCGEQGHMSRDCPRGGGRGGRGGGGRSGRGGGGGGGRGAGGRGRFDEPVVYKPRHQPANKTANGVVLTNYFQVQFNPKIGICIYNAHFPPGVERDVDKKRLINAFLDNQILPSNISKRDGFIVLTGGSIYVHSQFGQEFSEKPVTVSVRLIKRDIQEYTLSVTKASDHYPIKLDPPALKSDNFAAHEQILNIIMHQVLRHYAHFDPPSSVAERTRNEYYDSKSPDKYRVEQQRQWKVVAKRGWIPRIQHRNFGWLLVVEARNSVTRPDYTAQELSDKQMKPPAFPLRKCKLVHRSGYVDISGVEANLTADTMLPGTKQTYRDYFLAKYQIPIENSSFFLRSADDSGSSTHFPSELVYITLASSHVDRRAEGGDCRVVKELTEEGPDTKYEHILDFFDYLQKPKAGSKYSALSILELWGIRYNNVMMEVHATNVSSEFSIYVQGANTHIIQKDNIASASFPRTLGQMKFARAEPMKNWLVLVDKTGSTEQFCRTLLESFQDTAYKRGIGYQKPIVIPLFGDDTESNAEHWCGELKKYIDTRKTNIVLCLTNSRTSLIYGAVNSVCIERGIVEQFCLSSKCFNLLTKRPAVLSSNLLVQIQCKLGNIPWKVDLPQTRLSPYLVIIGVDVSRMLSKKYGIVDEAGSRKMAQWPAVIAFVALASRPRDHQRPFATYRKAYKIDAMTEIAPNEAYRATRDILQEYYKEFGNRAEAVIVIRDGVGDQQMDEVMDGFLINPGNEHLSVGDIPFKYIFPVSTFLWTILAVIWCCNWIIYRHQRASLHRVITLYPAIRIVSTSYNVAFFWVISKTGFIYDSMLVFYYLFVPTAVSAFFLVLLLISYGWGINGERLGRFLWILVGLVGGLFLTDFLSLFFYFFSWMQLFNFVIYAISLYVAFRSINLNILVYERRCTSKSGVEKDKMTLQMFRMFRIIIISYIVCKILISFTTLALLNYPFLPEVLNGTADLIMFICIAITFRLRPHNIYYRLHEMPNILAPRVGNEASTQIQIEEEIQQGIELDELQTQKPPNIFSDNSPTMVSGFDDNPDSTLHNIDQ